MWINVLRNMHKKGSKHTTNGQWTNGHVFSRKLSFQFVHDWLFCLFCAWFRNHLYENVQEVMKNMFYFCILKFRFYSGLLLYIDQLVAYNPLKLRRTKIYLFSCYCLAEYDFVLFFKSKMSLFIICTWIHNKHRMAFRN